MKPDYKPTNESYIPLQDAYEFFNRELFDSTLVFDREISGCLNQIA